MTSENFSRRSFFKLSAAAASSLVLPSCARHIKTLTSETESLPRIASWQAKVTGGWVPKREFNSYYSIVKAIVEAATDFSWLSKGDTVLLKIALNSGHRYPATTDPWVLSSMIKLLREKGAGRVAVGDSSGVESVQWTKDAKRGSSRECCRSAGLLNIINEEGAEALFFEELGYDSFKPYHPAGAHHWREPIWITDALQHIDHIIFLPRMGSHVIADFSSGMKIGVGFLREDSRMALHQGGENFYALYEEINQLSEINNKLRLIISSGRKVLTTFGPDQGHISEPDYGLIIASSDLFAHEVAAYAWLLYNREKETDFIAANTTGRISNFSSFINRGFSWYIWSQGFISTPGIKIFTPGNIFDHPALVNAMIRHSGRPSEIQWENINMPPEVKTISGYIENRISKG